MKYILSFILSWFCVISVFADTGASSFSWVEDPSDPTTVCPNTTSHSDTHQGIPNVIDDRVARNGGPRNCTTHLYYGASDTVRPTSGARIAKGVVRNCLEGERVVDIQRYNAGNPVSSGIWDEYTLTCRNWDDSSPNVSYTLVGGTSINNIWANADVDASINCSDNVGALSSGEARSGCSGEQYRIESSSFTCNSGGTWTNGSSRTFTANGTYYICFRANDVAGNPYSYTSVATIKIDKIDPTSSITYTKTTSNTAYSIGSWTNEDVRVVVTCNDTGGSNCDMLPQAGWTVNAIARTYTRVFSSTTPAGTINIQDVAGNSISVAQGAMNIDKIAPTSSSITYTKTTSNTAYTPGTWTNENVRVVVTCNDTGGSDCDMLPQAGWTVNAAARTYTRVFSVSALAGSINLEDRAGNIRNVAYGEIKIDKIAPTLTDVSNTNPLNMLANNAYNYNLNIGINGGSPIVSIQYQRENASNNLLSSTITDTIAPWSFSWDISQVDNYRVANGSRPYRFVLRQMCDEAGNCWNGTQTSDHNVYANTLAANITTKAVTSEALSANTNVADGTQKDVVLRLRDVYGNSIIPATGIGRTIDVTITANNALRLDQYANTALDTAIFAGTNTTALPIDANATLALNNRSSTTGDYTIPFYIFAPTHNSDTLVPGSASISSIRFDIKRTTEILSGDDPQNQTLTNSAITIKSKPLYTSQFSGEIIVQGFIEGAIQNSNINITKDATSSAVTSSSSLRMEFGTVDAANANIVNPRYSFTLGSTPIIEGHQSAWTNTTHINTLSSSALSSLLSQDTSVIQQTQSYLASIIKYTIGGKTVVYPHRVIGKTSYHGTGESNNSYQAGIKILGNTSSKNTQEIVTQQFNTDVHIFGKIEKTLARKDIQEKVYEAIRNIIPNTSLGLTITSTNLEGAIWSDSGLQAKSLQANTVLYFATGVVVSASTNIEGNKTLVVEGGNIYITGNIRDIDNDAMLGLIALSKNGQGGNIYIDPQVTDIHAVMYTDKSILSYDGMKEFDASNSLASELRHQLYIHGSIFSENTIGGSQKNPPVCPYFINTLCSALAQKYDLNYLRRYFRYDTDNNGILDAFSGNRAFAGGSVRGSRDAEFQNYPVIIEYDARIQQNPPPFFGN